MQYSLKMTKHKDDIAVDKFATLMKRKMAVSRMKGRSGWDDPEQCSVDHLANCLIGHLLKPNNDNFVDIANFCMILDT